MFTGRRKRLRSQINRKTYRIISSESENDLTNSDRRSERIQAKRRRTLTILSSKIARQTRSSRTSRLAALGDGYRESESDITLSDSSERAPSRHSHRTHKQKSSLRYELASDSSDFNESEEPSTSRSSAKPKRSKSIKYFPTDDDTEFAERHQYWCMHSSDLTAIEDDKRAYAMCQGCSYMYHVECLGIKQKMGHNVIILDEKDGKQTCVLQCLRCNGGGKNGTMTVRCLVCAQIGERCGEFKYPEKNSEDLLDGWNDESKVMFRCMNCERACHFNHLLQSSNSTEEMQVDGDIDEVVETCTSGKCNECREYEEKKVDIVLGWRQTGKTTDVPEFNRDYLVKFEDESYARALWVPGTWLSGVSFAMKRHFDAKESAPIISSEDVIPEAWLRADIIFDVIYDDEYSRNAKKFPTQSQELEAITRVTSALCKWQQLKYEESSPPLNE